MFLAVIAGYIIAASLAFCGVANLVNYIGAADRSKGYAPFLHGLAVELWPLAVAVAILLLIELACMVEKMHIFQKMMGIHGEADAPPPPVKPRRRPAPKEEETENYFRTHPSGAPKPQPAPAPPPVEVKPAERKPAAEAPTQAAPEAASGEAGPAPAPAPKPEEPKELGLSYFKLD